MAKIELKGTILRVLPVETVGTKNTKKQSVIFQVPAFTDAFGEKKGEDEEWNLGVIGDKVDTMNLLSQNLQGKKAKVTVYINSKRITKTNGEEMHIINANINAIEVVPGQVNKDVF